MLVEKLDLPRDPSRQPLFDVMFAMQNYEQEKIMAEGLIFAPYERENTIAKFDLTLVASERDQGIEFLLDYRTDLFKPNTAKRMTDDYLKILETVANNPQIWLGDIELMQTEQAELQNVLEEELNFSFE